ncbi:hypothetical protein D3C76_1764730 [compost metagenome]
MTKPTMWNMPWEKASSTSTTGFPRSPRLAKAMPSKEEKSRICRISFLAKASTTLPGIRWSRKSVKPPVPVAAAEV